MQKTQKNKKSGDPGGDFEHWLRYMLPWQLNLSPCKQVAVDETFYQFASFARMLAAVAPEEFEIFFNELKSRMDKIAKWRAPKSTMIVPVIFQGKPEYFPNGKYKYCLVERRKKQSKFN